MRRRWWPSGIGGPGPETPRPYLFWAWVCWLELTLNHPYWHSRPDYPNWAPLSEKVCDIADWLTHGWAHD